MLVRLTSWDRMVDERAENFGHATERPRVWKSGSALAPGRRGPMTPASTPIATAVATAAG